ncbi:hypothetical protein ACG04R_23330 [Roseateles sp. BYS78W]|uniref:Pilus assembly protein PilO n=1 Tax=Pelomonas candidula TaxID=3299025 RepID=A0ABW7HI82_9BURK
MKTSMAWIAIARLHQCVGAAGIVGLFLAAAAAVGGGLSWREHRRFESEMRAAASSTPVVAATLVQRTVSLPLRPPSDVPLLLARMERAAVQQGLGWPRADYRMNAASDDMPASLEVHCSLKGPYPRIRSFVSTLLQDTPTLTLREFSVRRQTAETSDVEAKLGIVIYLASDAVNATTTPGGPR